MQMQYCPKKNQRSIDQRRISEGRKQTEHTVEERRLKKIRSSILISFYLRKHF